RSAALPNREELVGGLPFLRNQLSRIEMRVLATTGDQHPIRIRKAFEKRMLRKERINVFLHMAISRRLWLLGLPYDTHFFLNINADGAPGYAAPTPDTARSSKLINPRRELMSHPLPVARECSGSHGASVDVRMRRCETGIPSPPALSMITGE